MEAVNLFSDAVFNGKDLVMVVGFAITVLIAFLTLKFQVKENQITITSKIDANKEDLVILQQDVIHSKNGRKALREEVKEDIKERFLFYSERLNKVEMAVKENQETNNKEFKDINEKLNKIIGMLDKK